MHVGLGQGRLEGARHTPEEVMAQTYFGSKRPEHASLAPKDSKREVDIVAEGAVLRIAKRGFQVAKNKRIALAAFDLDGTLITTKSGYKFAANGNDWKLLPHTESALPTRLAELREHGTDIQVVCVVFTNQGGVIPSRTAKSFVNIRQKLEGVADKLRHIDLIYASLQIKDPQRKRRFRKPGPGMFELLEQELACKVDRELSFYVGDAAGRPQDHSADDHGFAQSTNLRFFTPEEFFAPTQDENCSEDNQGRKEDKEDSHEDIKEDEDHNDNKDHEEDRQDETPSNSTTGKAKRDA